MLTGLSKCGAKNRPPSSVSNHDARECGPGLACGVFSIDPSASKRVKVDSLSNSGSSWASSYGTDTMRFNRQIRPT
jgi:hypothetical protein